MEKHRLKIFQERNVTRKGCVSGARDAHIRFTKAEFKLSSGRWAGLIRQVLLRDGGMFWVLATERSGPSQMDLVSTFMDVPAERVILNRSRM